VARSECKGSHAFRGDFVSWRDPASFRGVLHSESDF